MFFRVWRHGLVLTQANIYDLGVCETSTHGRIRAPTIQDVRN